MNITEYIKRLLYEYRLNKMKSTTIKMKHNLWELRRDS